MARPRASLVFGLLFLVAIGAAAVHEVTRARVPAATPVTSAPPLHPDEIERTDGGFEVVSTRGGRPLFSLEGRSMVRMDGGVQLVRGVERLSVFLEDGRSVRIRADRGRLVEQGRDSEETIARLEGNVVVDDPDGTRLTTDVLEYDSLRGELRCVTPTRIAGPQIDADVGSLVYRPDSRVIDGLRTLVIRHVGETPWRIDTSGATYRMATAEMIFEQPFRLRSGTAQVVSGPGVLHPASEGRPSRFEGGDGAFLLDRRAGGSFSLAAAGLVASGSAASLADFEARGPASVVVTEVRDGVTELLEIESGGWEIEPLGAGAGQKIIAGPGYTMTSRTAGGTVSLSGARLEARRTEAGAIQRVDGTGGAALSGPEGASARGDVVRWSSDMPSRVVLLGEPARAAQGEDVVEAPRITVDRETGRLEATEGILAELSSVRKDEAAPGALFQGDEPVRVSATSVSIPQRGGEIVFQGPVQAWQNASTLRALRLRYGRERQQLVAEGNVDLRIDRQTEQGTTTTRLRGERLDYSIPARVAVVSGPARMTEGEMRLDAEVMRIDLDDASEFERLVATNAVRLVTADAIGRADRLIWEGGATGTIVLVGEKDVAQLQFTGQERSGTLRVGRLRYDLTTGRAAVESGPGRGTLESEPGRADGGTDR